MTQEQLDNIIKLAVVVNMRRFMCTTLEKAPYFSPSIYDEAIAELEGSELALEAAMDEVKK